MKFSPPIHPQKTRSDTRSPPEKTHFFFILDPDSSRLFFVLPLNDLTFLVFSSRSRFVFFSRYKKKRSKRKHLAPSSSFPYAATRLSSQAMKVFSSTCTFDYSWDEVSTANWRKYCPWNDKATHVVGVDTLSRTIDSKTGIVSALLVTGRVYSPRS